MAARPRFSASSAARKSEARSPCVAGISTGRAPSLFGDREIVLGQAEQVIGAGRAPPRAVRRASAESTLTAKPSPFSARTASSRCGNGVSGRQPRSITSAPAARSAARARRSPRASSREASTISAKMPQSRGATDRARRRRLAEKRRQVFQFVGPALERARRIPAPEPVEIGAAAARDDHAIGVERTRQPVRAGSASVISAATFTPTSRIAQSNGGGAMLCKTFSSRRAREMAGQEQDALLMPRVRRAGASIAAREARRSNRPSSRRRNARAGRGFPDRSGADRPSPSLSAPRFRVPAPCRRRTRSPARGICRPARRRC